MIADEERARFYMTARGSAMECNALFDVLHLMSLTGDQVTREAKDIAERITAMLTKMTRS